MASHPMRGEGMRIGRALVVLAALMLVVSCGKPADQKAVEDSYNQLVDALEEQDGQAAFDLLSENTRDFMDQLAAAMTDMEIGAYEGGGDMLDEFLVGEGFTEFNRNIESVAIEGDVATLNTGTETLTFLKEGDAWRADLEDLIREGMEEGLEGTGITVDDILAGDLTGPGTGPTGERQSYETGEASAPVTIVNGLGSWDIFFVYVDPSSAPWGDDRLGSDILQPGDEITVLVDPGTYDMRVEDEDGDTYTKWEIEVGANGYQWEVTLAEMDASPPQSLEMTSSERSYLSSKHNELNDIIQTSEFDTYGFEAGGPYHEWLEELENWRDRSGISVSAKTIAGELVQLATAHAIGDRSNAEWLDSTITADLMTHSTDGGGASLMPVPEDYTVGEGSAPVTFTNDLGGWDIYGVLIDPSTEPQWGEERLGAEYMLTGGQSVTVMVDPGTYDMQVIDEDEDTYMKWEVTVGEEGYDWSVTLSDLD